MATLNIAHIIGYLGEEPRIDRLQDGNIKATLSIATTEKGYTTRSGSVIPDKTEWHTVTFWGNLAQLCERFLHKASCVYVSGKIRTKSWDDKNGFKHYRTEIEGNALQLLDRRPIDQKQGESSSQASNASYGQNQAPADLTQEDMPF